MGQSPKQPDRKHTRHSFPNGLGEGPQYAEYR